MKLSNLTILLLCQSGVNAFAPSSPKTQRSVAVKYASHPYAGTTLVDSEASKVANGFDEQYVAYAEDVMKRYEEQVYAAAEPKASVATDAPVAKGKSEANMSEGRMLVRNLGIASDKPVTKAKPSAPKKPGHRRTLTPMERKLLSEETIRNIDSIKPLKAELGAPPQFYERPSETKPRTGAAGEPFHAEAWPVDLSKPTSSEPPAPRTLRRLNDSEPTEWKASIAPVTASPEHRPMMEERPRVRVVAESTKKMMSPDAVNPMSYDPNHAYPYPHSAYSS